jgi:hypothetical protein
VQDYKKNHILFKHHKFFNQHFILSIYFFAEKINLIILFSGKILNFDHDHANHFFMILIIIEF